MQQSEHSTKFLKEVNDLLLFLRQYWKDNGYSPTLSEISSLVFQKKYRDYCRRHLDYLIETGRVERVSRHRGYKPKVGI